uniref:Uncharacterized protein n=1 Tax=Lutzomyia longipalpis TaxID=7200 RepID=A0A1B0GKP8_LUTLO
MFPEKTNPDKLLEAEFNPCCVVEFSNEPTEKVLCPIGGRAILRITFQETQTPRDEIIFTW